MHGRDEVLRRRVRLQISRDYRDNLQLLALLFTRELNLIPSGAMHVLVFKEFTD